MKTKIFEVLKYIYQNVQESEIEMKQDTYILKSAISKKDVPLSECKYNLIKKPILFSANEECLLYSHKNSLLVPLILDNDHFKFKYEHYFNISLEVKKYLNSICKELCEHTKCLNDFLYLSILSGPYRNLPTHTIAYFLEIYFDENKIKIRIISDYGTNGNPDFTKKLIQFIIDEKEYMGIYDISFFDYWFEHLSIDLEEYGIMDFTKETDLNEVMQIIDCQEY